MELKAWTNHMTRIVAATRPCRPKRMMLGYDIRHAVAITPDNGDYIVASTDSDHLARITPEMIEATGVVVPTDFDEAAEMLDHLIDDYLAEVAQC